MRENHNFDKEGYGYEIFLHTPDGYAKSYRSEAGNLSIDITLWNDEIQTVIINDVKKLIDIGTWECDGIIFYPELDDNDCKGYAVVDSDGNPTLQFCAKKIII